MRPSSLLLACTLLLPLSAPSLTGEAVRAQGLFVPSPPPQAMESFPNPPRAFPPTLAQALAALPPPTQDLYLAVGADKTLLPPNALPPDPASQPNQVGAAYGRLTRGFGGVMALAPPDMVVLNTRPGIPDPYDGMSPGDALKLLMASLTPAQWTALTSQSGLGAADLTNDSQRGLLRSVLPSGHITGFPEYGPFISQGASEPVTLAVPSLGDARLRLGRRMQIGIPATGGTRANYLTSPIAGAASYDVNAATNDPRAADTRVALRQVLPNNPKDADLDYDAPPLKQSVRLEGIVTVGDLVARVGQAAGLELYADRHYETRRVTLIGRRTAREVDLLRAVAFCVTGTFRRVGPAYVLTDDLQGTIPRRQILARYLQAAAMARHATVEAAGDGLVTAHGGVDALPALDGLDFSEEQRALPLFNRGTLGGDLALPFAQLTRAQQEYASGLAGQVASSGNTRLDLNGSFTLQSRPALLLVSPAAPGPLFLGYLSACEAFQPSANLLREPWHQEAAARAVPLALGTDSAPALVPLLTSIPRRAVLAAPRTVRAVDRVVVEMKKIGLNQLWLDVFSGGHSHLDKPDGGGPDILTEALARIKGSGIVVIPTLDLLRWGMDAPIEARDLTASGETSAQAQAWQQHASDIYTGLTTESPPADLWACPAAPATEETLLALVRRLAATPGVTTLALRDTAPPGYAHAPNSGVSESDGGYTPSLRLMFLRRDHIDPVDLDGGYDPATSLPEFEDIHSEEYSRMLMQAGQDWNALREEISRALLRRLLAAAQDTSGRRFRFLVKQRGDPPGMAPAGWYGLWDDPDAPLPEVPRRPPVSPVPLRLNGWTPPEEVSYAPVAHTQCRVNLYAFPWWSGLVPYIARDLLRMIGLLRAQEPGWDGIVLDMTGPGGGDRLADLARGAAP